MVGQGSKIRLNFGLFGYLPMNLTRRQETFIYKLLDLYRELDGPIHYSLLADRVGVSPFTAYDMLRLLEEKGLVASEYHVANNKPIPGRSEVLFWPTERAQDLWSELTGDPENVEWKAVNERLLERFRCDELREHDLAEEMLARLSPGGPAILRYCIEVMSIVVLRLGRGSSRSLLAKHLPQILEGQGGMMRSGLLLLGGFALGMLAEENSGDPEWSRDLLTHVQRYQNLILKMEPRLCLRLGESMKQVLVPLLTPE
jgi:DNA-binding MarR family transcriptional regulator